MGKESCQVLVVGAGPVGLVLAHELGARGIDTVVVERRSEAPAQSMAIGITPPSLSILRSLGLGREFVEQGVRIRRARVYENLRHLGDLDFGPIPSPDPFILSLPQGRTLGILEAGLSGRPTVRFYKGTESLDLEEHSGGVRAVLEDVLTGRRMAVSACWVVGCDGHRSLVRERAGIGLRIRPYRARFVMADFEDGTGWGVEARVFFGSMGAVESFPLPGARRRWIVQVTGEEPFPDPAWLVRQVAERTGERLGGGPFHGVTDFQPKWALADGFHRGRLILCGDAAHVMSPIGGQGMNTGFADARLLGEVLSGCLRRGRSAEAALSYYERVRLPAFRVAAARAARGMWIGTRVGRWWSLFREQLIRRVLFHPRVKPRLAGWFAMLDLPAPTGEPGCGGRKSSGPPPFGDEANCRRVGRRMEYDS